MFYLDANMLGVAKAFDLLKPDEILYPGKQGCPITSTRVSDQEWLRVAGENDWIVFTRDKHIRSRPQERNAMLEAGVRVFCLTGKEDYSKWDQAKIIMKNWDSIELIAEQPGPYIYSVTSGGGLRQVA